MTHIQTMTRDEQEAAFLAADTILCPSCGHGISPHGADPGGPCGVSGCPCLLSPNGVAHLLLPPIIAHNGTCGCEENPDD